VSKLGCKGTVSREYKSQRRGVGRGGGREVEEREGGTLQYEALS